MHKCVSSNGTTYYDMEGTILIKVRVKECKGWLHEKNSFAGVSKFN